MNPRGLCFTLLALGTASSIALAAGEPKLAQGQRWNGAYECGSTVIPATLEIISLSQLDSEQFDVLARLSLTGQAEASYSLKGKLHTSTNTVSLAPVSLSGLGYQPTSIAGNIAVDGLSYEGTVTHPRCTRLSLRAGAIGPLPTVFGIPLGARLEIPACPVEVRDERQCSPSGLSCWVEQKRVEGRSTTCQSTLDQRIYFAGSEQPGWVKGGLQPTMSGRELIGFEFMASDSEAANAALSKRFGPPTSTTAETQGRDAVATCFNEQCTVTPAISWVEYRYTWEREGLLTTLFEGVVTVRTLDSSRGQQVIEQLKNSQDRKQQQSGRTF